MMKMEILDMPPMCMFLAFYFDKTNLRGKNPPCTFLKEMLTSKSRIREVLKEKKKIFT